MPKSHGNGIEDTDEINNIIEYCADRLEVNITVYRGDIIEN